MLRRRKRSLTSWVAMSSTPADAGATSAGPLPGSTARSLSPPARDRAPQLFEVDHLVSSRGTPARRAPVQQVFASQYAGTVGPAPLECALRSLEKSRCIRKPADT